MSEPTQTCIRTIKVYDTYGRVFSYNVSAPTEDEVCAKVREHAGAIVATGYRHNNGDVFEWLPPHSIVKVQSKDIPTKYIDTVSGT